VETADRERRALERDLHDGAQQRLLALSYDIRLAQASAAQDGDDRTVQTLAQALHQTQEALDELRELARGIYPAILSDAGLLPALAGLADNSPVLIDIAGAPDRRYSTAVETAAYFAIAEVIDEAVERNADRAALTIEYEGDRLRLTFVDDGCGRTSPMSALGDRIGALGGTVTIEATRCRLEMPCG
jgi:signal transduction histidine kinase